MAPKPGNAFAQQKEAKRLRQLNENLMTKKAALNLDQPSKTFAKESPTPIQQTTLNVPSAHDQDLLPTPCTTMEMLIGPETEQEIRGREMREQQHAEMVERINAANHSKKSHTGWGSRPKVSHPSALPGPLFHGRFGAFKNMFGKGQSKQSGAKHKPAYTSSINGNQELEDAYDQSRGSFIRGPHVLVPAPSFFRNGQQKSPDGETVLNPCAEPFQTERWPRSVTDVGKHDSANTVQTLETNSSQYSARNQNSGMVMSHSSLTPTRTGHYATFQHPVIIHPPSMASMAGIIVDTPASPLSLRSPKHTSILNPVPEAAESSAEQQRRASEIENLYKKDADDSHSLHADTKSPGVYPAAVHSSPCLRRSSSVPNMAFEPFRLRATGHQNAIGGASECAVTSSSTSTDSLDPAFTADLKDPKHRGETIRVGLRMHSFEEQPSKGRIAFAPRNLLESQMAIQMSGVHQHIDGLNQHVADFENTVIDRFKMFRAEVNGKIDEVVARMESNQKGIVAKLDAILSILRPRQVTTQNRLNAMPPHIPYGSQAVGGPARRDVSGGARREIEEWYQRARGE